LLASHQQWVARIAAGIESRRVAAAGGTLSIDYGGRGVARRLGEKDEPL